MADSEGSAPARPLSGAAWTGLGTGNLAASAALLLVLGLVAFAYRGLAELAIEPQTRAHPEVIGTDRFFFVPASLPYHLLAPLFLWMLAIRLRRLRACLDRSENALPAAVPLAGAATLLLWAHHTTTPALLVPSLALLLLGGGWLLGGRAGMRELLRPALFLYFAWPWPGVLTNQVVWALQLVAVELASGILTALGVSHAVSGDQIAARGYLFQVIETCSGMRSMETLAMASVVYCEIFGRRGRRVWGLLVASLGIAVLLNGLRVVTIILNPYSETIGVHSLQGLVMIALGVFALAGVDRLLDRLGRLRDSARRPLPNPERVPFRTLRWAALMGVLIVLGATTIALPPAAAVSAALPPIAIELPDVLGAWSARSARFDRDFLGTVGWTQGVRRDYFRDGDLVSLFAAEDDRRQPAASLFSPKTRLLGTAWSIESSAATRLDGWEVERLMLSSERYGRAVAFHWRRGAESRFVEVVRAMLALDRSPLRRDAPLRVLRIATPITSDRLGAEQEAERRLLDFAEELARAPFLSPGPSPEVLRDALWTLGRRAP